MKTIIVLVMLVIVAFVGMVQNLTTVYSVMVLNGNRDTVIISENDLHAGDTIYIKRIGYDNKTWEQWFYSTEKKCGTETIMIMDESDMEGNVYTYIFSEKEWQEYDIARNQFKNDFEVVGVGRNTFVPNAIREYAKAVVIEKPWFWSHGIDTDGVTLSQFFYMYKKRTLSK